MELLNEERKEKCTGCTACTAICPKRAITMVENEQGFVFPVIADSICIDCGMCVKVCPIEDEIFKPDSTYPKVYAAKYKNDCVREKSSSGGVFTAISDYVLERSGVIYGCAYDDQMIASHIRVENKQELEGCLGSKYVQSDLKQGSIFRKVQEDLRDERLVLFSGTPCQVDGLNRFLGKRYDNLITIDLVCHGVPSPKLFRDHICLLRQKRKKDIIKYENRSKIEGWGKHIEIVSFAGGKKEYKTVLSQAWKRIYYSHNCLREACYTCKYTSVTRVADITIADFWGVEQCLPDFIDDKGVSLILLNNSRWDERKLFKNLKYIEVSGKNWIQRPLKEPVKQPATYADFWALYWKNGYKEIVKKYANYSVIGIAKESIKKVIYRRNYIP